MKFNSKNPLFIITGLFGLLLVINSVVALIISITIQDVTLAAILCPWGIHGIVLLRWSIKKFKDSKLEDNNKSQTQFIRTSLGEILTEIRNALTVPTKGSLTKAIILLLSILIAAVALSFILQQFFPEEELERFAKWGYSGVFLVTLVSSMSIMLPLPGTVVVIAAADIWNPPLVALVASIGGTLGEISAYLLGYGGRAVISGEHTERFRAAQDWMQRRGGLGIFLFALIPFLIFDFIGIAAGIFRYPVKKFLLFTWLGRFPRSLIEIYIGVTLLDFILDHLTF